MAKSSKVVLVNDETYGKQAYTKGRSFGISDHGFLEVYDKGGNLIGTHRTWGSAHLTKQETKASK